MTKLVTNTRCRFSTCPRWRPIYSFNLFWKFFLTRTMFSGLHLSLSLTVVNVSYRNYFNDLGYRLQLSCFRKSGKKSSHINLARRLFCKVTTNILNLPNFSPTFFEKFSFSKFMEHKERLFRFCECKDTTFFWTDKSNIKKLLENRI